MSPELVEQACLVANGQTHPPACTPSTNGHSNNRFPWLVGRSKALLKAVRSAEQAAGTACQVLLTGQTGTGKELLARVIHEASGRKGKFVAINIAAIPDGLLESELFGHVRGAFTGATAARQGCFVEARAGTLLLDEIGELDLASQAKLLRVLEEHKVRAVGDDSSRAVSTRVVAATSRNLERLVSEGRFREDLYYRLNLLRIHSPALKDRRRDIPLLVEHFVQIACKIHDKNNLAVESDLLRWLNEYDWPGNIRQLRNLIESMVVMAEHSRLTFEELPDHLPARSNTNPLQLYSEGTLREIENYLISRRLEQYNGSKVAAARSLDISVRTIQRRSSELDTLKLRGTPSKSS